MRAGALAVVLVGVLLVAGQADAQSRPWLAKDAALVAVDHRAAFEGPHYFSTRAYAVVRRKRWTRRRVMCTVQYAHADLFHDGSPRGVLWWRYVAVLRGGTVVVSEPGES